MIIKTIINLFILEIKKIKYIINKFKKFLNAIFNIN